MTRLLCTNVVVNKSFYYYAKNKFGGLNGSLLRYESYTNLSSGEPLGTQSLQFCFVVYYIEREQLNIMGSMLVV
jgi:hypothetical protein